MTTIVIILIIAIIVIIIRIGSSSNNQSETTRPRESGGFRQPVNTSISVAQFRQTVLFSDIQKLFTDINHFHPHGRALFAITKDDNREWKVLKYVFFFEDSEFNLFNLGINSVWNAIRTAVAENKTTEEVKEKARLANTMLFGSNYLPASELFDFPMFVMYKKGTPHPGYDPLTDSDNAEEDFGGFCLVDSFTIFPSSLMMLNDSSSYDEKATVEDQIIIGSISLLAQQSDNVKVIEKGSSGIVLTFDSIDGE